jgi:hypothetical protein
MTDQYPPFRLDQGPHEPEHALVVTSQANVQPPTQSQPGQPYPAGQTYPEGQAYPQAQPYYGPGGAPSGPGPGAGPGAPAPGAPGAQRSGWTPGRTVAAVVGVLVGLMSLGGLAAGGAMLVADRGFREDGFVTTPAETWSTGGYAALGDMLLEAPGSDQNLPEQFLGDLRIEATSSASGVPIFVGIGRQSDVSAYLSGVSRSVRNDASEGRDTPGGPPPVAPTELDIWVAQASGDGPQTAVWTPEDGNWSAVIMNADGSRGVSAEVRFGAEVPWLDEAGAGLFIVSLLFLGGAVTLVAFAVARASRRAQA